MLQSELETELNDLNHQIRKLERLQRFDTASGLPNRASFLEKGAAEFQRARRYDHQLSVVVLSLQGYSDILQSHGQEAGDRVMTAFGQMCETAYRSGADLAGRMADDEIGVILPETNLAGALNFMDRLRSLVAKTPVQLERGMVRLGVLYGVEALSLDDYSFMEGITRAKGAMTNRLS